MTTNNYKVYFCIYLHQRHMIKGSQGESNSLFRNNEDSELLLHCKALPTQKKFEYSSALIRDLNYFSKRYQCQRLFLVGPRNFQHSHNVHSGVRYLKTFFSILFCLILFFFSDFLRFLIFFFKNYNSFFLFILRLPI